jgi:hypothetical protein
MIIDRSQEDVNAAIDLRNTKIKTFEELTESDIKTLERGFFTINTLNRIEQKQKELSDILALYGYVSNCENKTDWIETDIPNESDYQRILDNMDKLKNSYTYMKTTPNTPTDLFHFQKMNDAEKILVDIEFLIDNMVSSWIYASNEYYAGEVI